MGAVAPCMQHIWLALVTNYLALIPLAFVLVTLVLRKKWTYDIAESAAGGVVTIVLVKLAGLLYDENRPFVVLHRHPMIDHVSDNSFPSDHLAATGLAVAYLWPRSRPLAIGAAVIGVALGTARVVTLLHWPIDIVAGFALGICGMLLGHPIIRKFPRT